MPQLGIQNLTASQGRVASRGPWGQVWGCSKACAHARGAAPPASPHGTVATSVPAASPLPMNLTCRLALGTLGLLRIQSSERIYLSRASRDQAVQGEDLRITI